VSIEEFDLSGYVCPLSRIKAAEVIDSLTPGQFARLIVGDGDSLKSVAQELKARELLPELKHLSDGRFTLLFTR
jgi:TusA-related sulfurtransferase